MCSETIQITSTYGKLFLKEFSLFILENTEGINE